METLKKISCIIVDDNELDRLALIGELRTHSMLQLKETFASAEEMLAYLQTNKPPDALFLDIDMPGMNGFELRRQLQNVPACIFVTAYPEYALESFELDVLDFLVKPIKADRLNITLERLTRFLSLHLKAELLDYKINNDILFIKDGHNYVQLHIDDVVYLEALKDYTCIITKNKKYHLLKPLSTLLTEKHFLSLVRIHRSYAVNRLHVKLVSTRELTIAGMSLPIGRTYRDAARQLLTAL